MLASSSDSMLPKALTDFVFDLYDSVTLSQLAEEQAKFYTQDFASLTKKYFGAQPWPEPQAIASECNGHPLFLAVYRELTHRHWHSVSRPTLRDRMEGWQVYRELFEEILEADDPNYYLLPSWVFDILHEFVYQFQGFCQIRSALYATGRKHGILQPDGSIVAPSNGQHANLVENLNTLQGSKDAWDVELVFSYLHRMVQLGTPKADGAGIQPVYSYLSIFSSVALSRLECLLGDYTACLQALTPIMTMQDLVIPTDSKETVMQVLQSVFPARLSMAYHAGVSFLMLKRYKDASKTLGDLCAYMQRGFKTGQLRKLPGSEQFNKQYERMLALLAILAQVCPNNTDIEDSVARAIREKHGSKLEAATSYEDWFQSPKFVSVDPTNSGVYRQQVQQFLKGMENQASGRKLRSYLKLYTSMQVEKLSKFHDMTEEEFLPLLLSYKARMRQLERASDSDTYIGGTYKTALDLHFYLEGNMVHVDEAEKQRRFETYFVSQIDQNTEILRDVVAVNTTV